MGRQSSRNTVLCKGRLVYRSESARIESLILYFTDLGGNPFFSGVKKEIPLFCLLNLEK
jgi:hypothetical protein